MFLVITRNFPPDIGGTQSLVGGLSESLLNHGPVKVFAYEYPDSNIYDSKSPINIERVKGIKLFRKYRKANLVNNFIDSNYNNLHSIIPSSKPGFKLGFISDFNLIYPFDLRTLLQVGFYEFNMDYLYTDGTIFSDTRSATLLEFPLLIKYKSKRRGNHRMYMLGGLKPSLEIGAKNKDEAGKDILDLKSFDSSF